jgi:hypothetical protein
MTELERHVLEHVLASMARGMSEPAGRDPLVVRRALVSAAASVLAREHGREAAVGLLRELVEVAETGEDAAALRDAEAAGSA